MGVLKTTRRGFLKISAATGGGLLLGISLPGLAAHRFGSFVVSNIGSLGLEVGFPALFPVGQVPFVLILGGIREQPWVVDGQITVRTIMQLSIAMDHRLLDASHGGRLFRYLKNVVRQPEVLEDKALDKRSDFEDEHKIPLGGDPPVA